MGINVHFSRCLESRVAWRSLVPQHGGSHIHVKTKPVLLPCVTGIYLPSSFYCFGVFVGVRGVCMGLASLYNIIKHLQMINLIPGPLAQLWENVKSDFSGIGKHLCLPQKLRTLFYLENYEQDLGFPMLAVCFPLLITFPFSRNTPLWFYCYLSNYYFFREREDANKTLRHACLLSDVGKWTYWNAEFTWRRCWFAEADACVKYLTPLLDTKMLFCSLEEFCLDRPFEYLHLISRESLLLTWVKASHYLPHHFIFLE